MNIKLIPLAAIDVPPPLLAYHGTRTVEIAKSLRAGIEIKPLSVVKIRGRHILVEGKDELAALKLVGAETAPVRIEMIIGNSARRNRRGIS
jgi:hypothetical protein